MKNGSQRPLTELERQAEQLGRELLAQTLAVERGKLTWAPVLPEDEAAFWSEIKAEVDRIVAPLRASVEPPASVAAVKRRRIQAERQRLMRAFGKLNSAPDTEVAPH